MKSEHARKLGLSGVALVRGRVRYGLEMLTETRARVQSMMIQENFLSGAPFEWISLVIRYGIKNEQTPEIQRINSRYKDLPVSIEVDMKEILRAPREKVGRVFFDATMKALVAVGKKYLLPVEAFERALAESEQQAASENTQ